MSTNEIKALERREKELEEQLAQVRGLLHAAKSEAAGIACGDVVVRKGIQYKVSRIKHWSFGPVLHGFKKLKNGDWHKRDQYIGWEWEKA